MKAKPRQQSFVQMPTTVNRANHRPLCILLSLLLCVLARQVAADQIGDFGYITVGNTVTITNYYGSASVLAVPGSLSGLPVTAIGPYAFASATSLSTITIPDSVASIGDGAFLYCTRLASVKLSNNLTNLGQSAFYFCTNLSAINLPNGLLSIGSAAFAYCMNLATVTIPDSVTALGSYAFGSCARLASATISKNLTSLADQTFYNCPSLTGVYFPGAPPALGQSVFAGDALAVAYYLAEVPGWGSTFDLLPTAPWLPRALNSDESFGVRTNRFGFTLVWASGKVVVVEASPRLANPTWLAINTNALAGGSAYFSDPQWTNYPARFYRIRSQ